PSSILVALMFTLAFILRLTLLNSKRGLTRTLINSVCTRCSVLSQKTHLYWASAEAPNCSTSRWVAALFSTSTVIALNLPMEIRGRSEERRVGKGCIGEVA